MACRSSEWRAKNAAAFASTICSNPIPSSTNRSFERPAIAADFWPRLIQAYNDQHADDGRQPHRTIEHWQACWLTMAREHQTRLRCIYDAASLTDDDYRRSRLMSVMWFDVQKWRNEAVPMLWLTVVPIGPRGYCKGYLPPSFTASNVAGGPTPVEENVADEVAEVEVEAETIESPPFEDVETTIVEAATTTTPTKPSVHETMAAVEAFHRAKTTATEIVTKSTVSFVKPMPPAPVAQAKVTPPSRAQLEHIISYFEQQFMRETDDR